MKPIQKPLTKEEQKKVLAFRKQGLSIKAIAKEMHISDKRISAFINGAKATKETPKKKHAPKVKASDLKEAPKKTTEKKKCCESKCKCKTKKITLTWADMTAETDAAVGKYIGGLFDSIFKSMSDIFQDKDVSREQFIKQLEQISDDFVDAVAGVGLELLISMPPNLRVAWVKGAPFPKDTK